MVVVVPVVEAGSDGDPDGLKVGLVEVSLMVTTDFWLGEQHSALAKV